MAINGNATREQIESFISNAIHDCMTKPKRAVSPEGQLLVESFQWDYLREAAEMRDQGLFESVHQEWFDDKLRVSARMHGSINKVEIGVKLDVQ